jgi:hypothetical protein
LLQGIPTNDSVTFPDDTIWGKRVRGGWR